jgi:predicted MarR family transcription regulator
MKKMSNASGQVNVDKLVGAEHLRAIEGRLCEQLAHIRRSAEVVNIYRPLRAYWTLRCMSSEMDALKPQLDTWRADCTATVGNLDVTTMGKVVTAPVIMLALQMRVIDRQYEYNDICSRLNTLKAFAFGVFALYVSLSSLAVTLVLGTLSLVGKG